MFIYVLLLGLLFAVCYFGIVIVSMSFPEESRPEPIRLFGFAIGWTLIFLLMSSIAIYGGKELIDYLL